MQKKWYSVPYNNNDVNMPEYIKEPQSENITEIETKYVKSFTNCLIS